MEPSLPDNWEASVSNKVEVSPLDSAVESLAAGVFLPINKVSVSGIEGVSLPNTAEVSDPYAVALFLLCRLEHSLAGKGDVPLPGGAEQSLGIGVTLSSASGAP